MLESVPEAAKRSAAFHAWVTKNYVDSVAMGVRRLAAEQGYDYSLKRLLIELRQDAANEREGYVPALTREWYLGRSSSEGVRQSYEAAWSLMCDESGDRISVRYVQRDIDRLSTHPHRRFGSG